MIDQENDARIAYLRSRVKALSSDITMLCERNADLVRERAHIIAALEAASTYLAYQTDSSSEFLFVTDQINEALQQNRSET